MKVNNTGNLSYNCMEYLPPGRIRILSLPEVNRRLLSFSKDEKRIWGKVVLEFGVVQNEAASDRLTNDEIELLLRIKHHLFVRRI